MTVSVAFPVEFPAPLLAGFSEQIPKETVRTDFEAGTARQRRRETGAPVPFAASWLLSDAQWDQLKSWCANEAQGGAAWFSLTLKNGANARAYECRFVEMPAGEPAGGGWWRVSASLEYRGLA